MITIKKEKLNKISLKLKDKIEEAKNYSSLKLKKN